MDQSRPEIIVILARYLDDCARNDCISNGIATITTEVIPLISDGFSEFQSWESFLLWNVVDS